VKGDAAHRSAGAAAPRYARPFVALFVTAMAVCAFAPLNLWPFSTWELFSRLRSARETSWEAVAVGRSGQKHDYAMAAVPGPDRERLCAEWLRSGTRVVRIYHLERLLSDRDGNRAAPPRETLVWMCTTKGVREQS
jgi:hypothetical protein